MVLKQSSTIQINYCDRKQPVVNKDIKMLNLVNPLNKVLYLDRFITIKKNIDLHRNVVQILQYKNDTNFHNFFLSTDNFDSHKMNMRRPPEEIYTDQN